MAESQLDRVRVLGIELRIADEHVLDVHEHRERIQLLRPRPADAARIAEPRLVGLVQRVANGRAREQAAVAVG